MNKIKSHIKYRSNKLHNEVSLYYRYIDRLLEFARWKLQYYKEHPEINIDDNYLINLDFAALILMDKLKDMGFNTDKWFNYYFNELSIDNFYQKI